MPQDELLSVEVEALEGCPPVVLDAVPGLPDPPPRISETSTQRSPTDPMPSEFFPENTVPPRLDI